MATYYEKLQDVRWQKKRLEVFAQREWTCETCLRSSDDLEGEQLHVHHGYYEKNKDPWDYDAETLWVLCESCHTEAEQHLADIRRAIGEIRPDRLGSLLERIDNFANPSKFAEARLLWALIDATQYIRAHGLDGWMNWLRAELHHEPAGVQISLRSLAALHQETAVAPKQEGGVAVG